MAGGVWSISGTSTWTTDANWSSGTHPASNDDTQILDGAISIDGVDESSTDLDSIFVGPDYEGTIASSGTPLQLGCDLVSIKSGPKAGDIHLHANTAAFDDVRIDASPNNMIYLRGTITSLTVVHGNVTIVSGTVTTLNLEWDGIGHRPNVIIETPTVTTMNQLSGAVTTMTAAGTVTTANIDAGEFDVRAGTVVTYNQRGGLIKHETATTTTTLNAFGGTLDGSADGRDKTFTTINKHKNSTVNLNNGISGSITISNNNLIFGDPVQVA